jgi:hypothetical protein
LQDDIRSKRPSIDLALNLLCPTAANKLTRRSHFSTDAPLMRHRLLHLVSESDRLTFHISNTRGNHINFFTPQKRSRFTNLHKVGAHLKYGVKIEGVCTSRV